MPFDSRRTELLLQHAKELRRNMTAEERRLWFGCLRDFPIRIRRQEILCGYIADFYCSQAKLVIELDGEQHTRPEDRRKDDIRTRKMESRGYKVIRIPNREVWRNLAGVKAYIYREIKQRVGRPSTR